MIEEKILVAENTIVSSKQNIQALETEIQAQQKELERLRILEERLHRIEAIRYWENTGDTERITHLANQTKLRDFLHELGKITDIRYSPSLSEMKLSQLSIWQILFFLFGDYSELEKKIKNITSENIKEEETQGE